MLNLEYYVPCFLKLADWHSGHWLGCTTVSCVLHQ